MTTANELRSKARALWEADTQRDQRRFDMRPGETVVGELPAGGSYIFVITHKTDANPRCHGLISFRLWRVGPRGDRVPRSTAISLRADTLPQLAEAVAAAIDAEAERIALTPPRWMTPEGDDR